MQASEGAAPSRVRDVLRLAWPAMASFVCNSAYRINDQFWVQGLGPEAHAALGPSTFLLILNFSVFFLAVSGSMTLVSRATGAREASERDRAIRHALVLAVAVAVLLAVVGTPLARSIITAIGARGRAAELGTQYIETIYLVSVPLALAPLVETIFISMGHTRIPLALQILAVTANLILNPCLIYGLGPFPELGMAGAAWATGASRALSAGLGLVLLARFFGVRYFAPERLELRRLVQIARIGIPSALSIAIYSAVYFALIRGILAPLGDAVLAGLSIGFNVFEGVAFPIYLGIAVAGSSLVGRNLGAGALEHADQAVRSLRLCALGAGGLFAVAFLVLGPVAVPLFTDDPEVARQTLLYVMVLSASQLFVAFEAVQEKVLMGAGHTAPIFWVSVPGNVLRLPIGYLFAVGLGGGALGVWWAVNLTTVLKAGAYLWIVERKAWRKAALAP